MVEHLSPPSAWLQGAPIDAENTHPCIYHGTVHWALKKTPVFPTFLPHFKGGAGFALEIRQHPLSNKWLFRLLTAKAWYRDRLQPLRNAKKAMKVFTVTGKPLEISNWSICFSACARLIPARGSLITSCSLYLQIISAPQRRGFLQKEVCLPQLEIPQERSFPERLHQILITGVRSKWTEARKFTNSITTSHRMTFFFFFI